MDDRSPSDHYWMTSFSRSYHSPGSAEIQSLLPIEDVIENWRLTVLHRTVLRLNGLDVSSLLKAMSKSEIDTRDRYGRTALWWACQKADASTLSMLIQEGADVDIPSERGTSPLNLSFCKSHVCARILLDANANTALIFGKSGNDWLALPCASYYGTPIDIIQKLVLRGNDINITTNHGYTALMLAAQEGHLHCCEYLISQDADPELVNNDGECALHLAIYLRHPETIRFLLVHSIQHFLKTKAGESLLHYSAMYGDVATLEALQSIPLNGIDVEDSITSISPNQEWRDVVGRTAAQIAEQRSDVTAEWHEAFKRLLQAIMIANEGNNSAEAHDHASHLIPDSCINAEDMDHFKDAVEYQEPAIPPTNSGRPRSRTF